MSQSALTPICVQKKRNCAPPWLNLHAVSMNFAYIFKNFLSLADFAVHSEILSHSAKMEILSEIPTAQNCEYLWTLLMSQLVYSNKLIQHSSPYYRDGATRYTIFHNKMSESQDKMAAFQWQEQASQLVGNHSLK